MIAHRASAGLLVALVVLVGCRKKPADGPDDAPGAFTPGQAPTGSMSPAQKVIAAFDQMTKEMEQGGGPTFGTVARSADVPGHGDTAVVDASGVRPAFDGAFGQFFTAWDSRAERVRQSLVRRRIEELTKQGVSPDRAREQAEQAFRPVPPVRVTTPNPDLNDPFFSRIEAEVAGGVKGIWSQNGNLSVGGAVQFSELLRLQSNGDLTVRLRGRAERLDLHANGNLVADLLEVQAAVVEVRP
ncbi:MAG: hypothetical protein J0I06_10940, partial [Planctomycetes bacterium]|nr:hypothetical protein [Planctomycetota bacterium]